MKSRVTSNNIQCLLPYQVFVFGSNQAGRHGKGAAKTALDKFGAVYGLYFGLQGNSFAIPTKDRNLTPLTLPTIHSYTKEFISFAIEHKNLFFLVTEVGCGLAGFKPYQIAPLFQDCIPLKNVSLPASFWKVLKPSKFPS